MPPAVVTDPEVRRELRRDRAPLRRTRGDPGRVRVRARGRVSRSDRRADEGARAVRDHDPRGVRRARPRPPHLHRRDRGARVRLDVAVGHRQHAHDRGAPDRAPRHRGAEAALAAAARDRRAPRLPLAVGSRRGQRHAEPRVPRDARRRRVRRSTARSSGSRTASAPAWSRSRCAPTKASPASSSRRSPARAAVGSPSARTSASSGYKGIETVEMSYDDHRVPADALLGDAGRGLGVHPRRARGRPHQHRGPRGRRGACRVRRRARVRAATRRRSASRSPSTRRSR